MNDREAIAGLLEFERSWQDRDAHDGAKDQAIRERFGVSAIRYYQRLLGVVELPVALELDPVLCRLVRERADRRRRATGGLGRDP